MKVALILVDGMRPDAITNVAKAQEMIKKSASAMDATTVMPSVTLPCHVSLFHSVDSERHGTTTNIYAPQVRPINGLCEVLFRNEKTCAFFYDWEQLRDLSRPDSLEFSYFIKGRRNWSASAKKITETSIEYINENKTNFAFIYLGYPDNAGHEHNWMSKEYNEAVEVCWDHIDKIVNSLPEDYTVIVTADHGGHDRRHGNDIPEDMLIPVIIKGPDFVPGSKLENVNIKDLAPTIAKLIGVKPDEEWEGKSLI